ncbi:hypothetical protein BDV25DRAFT_169174 [Aspergillus avenaceus]|uniref:Zn(2)-C6 fungal-type domain-containing protein n=1 Tax=Aspergillus avenaceus TaxID=36643 RepID=A0A5N6U402_ASPAV|nr:hypothetical protein BDV25DRAFT_169174 [Aspergillus avenaceus]
MPAGNENKVFRRSYVACMSCRARKVRCILGSEPPCAKCEREHRECVFQTPRKPGRHRRAPRWSQGQSSSLGNHFEETDASEQPSDSGLSVVPDTSGIVLNTPETDPHAQDASHHDPPLSDRVMSTIFTRPSDALDVLFDAARNNLDESPSSQGMTGRGTAGGGATKIVLDGGLVSVPGLSQPSEDILDLWDKCRFVRQGWFTAQEAVTYLDLFYRYLAPLSPVRTELYSDHNNHEKLTVEEPMLCCTLLTISSRFFILPGAGGISRSHFIHHRLWQYCELLVRRIMLGQEKHSTAKTRIMGSIESLILISDWHPRSVHFPPETEGWDGELISPAYDRRNRRQINEDIPLVRWREDVFEPASRSERMSWMFLGAAVSLGYELGLFGEGKQIPLDPRNPQAVRGYRARKLLYTYVTQAAVRIGCPSPISDNIFFMSSAAPGHITESTDEQWEVYMKSWMELTRLMKAASAMFFQSIPYVKQQLASGHYVTFLQHFASSLNQWHDSFQAVSSNISEALGPLLLIEYHYLKTYTNAVAIQAVVERAVTSRISDISRSRLQACIMDHDQTFIRDVVVNSNKVLEIAASMATDGRLRYAPLRTLICVTSSSVFLLKAISLGARQSELQASLRTLDNCIAALRVSSTDDMDFSLRYARLLEKHVSRFRANFASPESTSAFPSAQIPTPATSAAYLPPNLQPETSHGVTGEDQEFGTDSGQGLEWWSRPFDPNVAPFNLEGEGVSLGLELDSLDFLWNLPQVGLE